MKYYPSITFSAIILVIILSMFNNTFSQRKLLICPKVCIDLAGNHSANIMGHSGDLKVNTGISLGFEVLTNNNSIFNFGGGLMYLIPREQEISGSGKFNFVPLYLLGKLDFIEEGDIVPSIIAAVGYNVIYNGDSNYKGPLSLKGGGYYSGGLRISAGKIFFEGLFKSFNGSTSLENSDYNDSVSIDLKYTTFSLGFGLAL